MAENSLRIVASIESLDYEIEYVRDDLADDLSDTGFEQMYENIVTEGLAGRDIGSIAGVESPELQIDLYERVVLSLCPTGKYEGVMISTDRDAGSTITDIVDTTASALPTSE